MNAAEVPLVCRVCGPVRGAVAALPRVELGGLCLLACPGCRRVLAVGRREDADPRGLLNRRAREALGA